MIDLKRYLADAADDDESSLVEISRENLRRYQLMECLYVGDVNAILASLPEDKIEEIKNFVVDENDRYVYIYLSERLRIGFKQHGTTLNPRCEAMIENFDQTRINPFADNPWYNVSIPYEEEEILERFPDANRDSITNEELLTMMFTEAVGDEKTFFERCEKHVRRHHYPRVSRLIINREVKFGDYFEVFRYRGHDSWVRVTDVPSLGWARFIRRMSYEGNRIVTGDRFNRRYKPTIIKKGDKWNVILSMPLIAQGDEKIARFIYYYADKIGLYLNKVNIDRIRNDARWGDVGMERRLVKYNRNMYKVFKYIDDNGEDSDEEIVEWLETATKW